ncbi:MAG TPA: hypothetical protein VF598_04180 [Hymenobacter sp.]|jgi:Gpi18-like mannosyltransferase
MKPAYQYGLLYVLLFINLLLLVPHAGYGFDVNLWTEWAVGIHDYGLSNVYHQVGNNDYPPLYQYVLFLFGKLAGSTENIHHYQHLLKAFTLLFDFAGAILAASLVADHQRRFILSLLLLFNAGYLYNTLVWEQVDAIFTCLTFAAVLLAVRHEPVWSLLFYVLALNTKPQAIIFLPALLLLWLPQWLSSAKVLPKALLAAVALQLLIVAPFVWGGDQNDLNRILDVSFGAVDRYPNISMNAYNFWFMLMPDANLSYTSDKDIFLVYNYKQWGLGLFLLAAVITLLPLFIITVRQVLARQRFAAEQTALILLTCGLIPLIFSYFNTQMHERYWHAALLFLAAYAFITREYSLYLITSFAYFLNIEAVIHFLNMKNYGVLLFQPRFAAWLFGIVILIGIWKLYRQANLRQQWALMREMGKSIRPHLSMQAAR